MFKVGAGASLTLTGSSNSDDEIMLTLDGGGEGPWTNGQIIAVVGTSTSGASLTLNPGVRLTNNYNGNSGGAIFLRGDMTMNGGLIDNCTADGTGGAINVAYESNVQGVLTMNGGTITGNKAKSGGSGVNVGNSTAKLTMKGGTIQENTGYDISLQSTANEKLVLDGKVTVGTVYIYGGTPYITATGSFQADSPVALSKASAITDSYQLIHFDDSVTDKAAVLAMFAPVETEGWSLNGEGTIVTGSIAAQLSRCLRGIFANLGGDRNV